MNALSLVFALETDALYAMYSTRRNTYKALTRQNKDGLIGKGGEEKR